jgi:hypothetical protein
MKTANKIRATTPTKPTIKECVRLYLDGDHRARSQAFKRDDLLAVARVLDAHVWRLSDEAFELRSESTGRDTRQTFISAKPKATNGQALTWDEYSIFSLSFKPNGLTASEWKQCKAIRRSHVRKYGLKHFKFIGRK